MAKRIAWTMQARADVRRIAQQTAMRVLEDPARYAAQKFINWAKQDDAR